MIGTDSELLFIHVESQAPTSDVQDKTTFLINKISTSNLEAKSKEFLEVLKEPHYAWFAQYMVMKRSI